VLRHGQLPLIDHQPRRGEETEFPPAKTMPYMERTVAERSKARLKDQFGGNSSEFCERLTALIFVLTQGIALDHHRLHMREGSVDPVARSAPPPPPKREGGFRSPKDLAIRFQ
jgi:hypothetical protein